MADYYINRSTAIRAAIEAADDWAGCRHNTDRAQMIETALMALPSEDVQPVVRCKDCKHSTEWYRDKRRCFLWCEDGIDVFEDGYCSYWERKDGEQNG